MGGASLLREISRETVDFERRIAQAMEPIEWPSAFNKSICSLVIRQMRISSHGNTPYGLDQLADTKSAGCCASRQNSGMDSRSVCAMGSGVVLWSHAIRENVSSVRACGALSLSGRKEALSSFAKQFAD